jgi:hypothetical protein
VEWKGTGPRPKIVEFSDNDFELMPKESKEIEFESQNENGDQSKAWTLIVNAANAPETTLPF